MKFVLIPLLSLLPCVLWLWYFSSQSRYKRAPHRVLWITFFLGAAATIPGLLLNLAGQATIHQLFGTGVGSHLLVLFLVVGPVEELIKFLVVYQYAWRNRAFDEPLDGVIYSATAALGFAAVENILYLSEHDPSLVLLRGPLSNPGHALFSAFWGLSLSQAKAVPNLPRERIPILVRGLFAASLLHSLFDVLLVAASRISPIFFGVLVIAMIALFLWVRRRIIYHQENSPHREGTILLTTRRFCHECGESGRARTTCLHCGAFIPEPEEMQDCPLCQIPQRPGAKFCTRCGANLRLPAGKPQLLGAHFTIRTPSGKERIAYLLNQPEITIGRTLNNQFVIDHPSVSKCHARLVLGDPTCILYDLESSNGTFVDGRRIRVTPLSDGCHVRFGRVNLVYRALRDTRTLSTLIEEPSS
jgi:RsiW-degrading membrane proteinase PrsW (M82 family)